MFNFVGGFSISSGAKFLADFFSVLYGMFGRTLANSISNFFAKCVNFIVSIFWYISQWILGMMDAIQLGFTRLLGIDTSTSSGISVDEIVEGAKGILVPGGTKYYDYIMKIFRAVFVVGIILMIVFTIVAMVLQEYKQAMNGYAKEENKKGKFFKVLFSNIMIIFLLPLIFYTIITGSTAILSSFYRAFGTNTDVSVAGNVLASATYDANRYRTYANSNKRIPITISVYSMENAFGMPLSDDELKKSINDWDNQEILKAIGGAFSNNSFLPFEKSTLCESGTWSSYKNYSLTYNNTVYDDLGDYFENFICTREQYYVMADFIDYCQLYNIKYYIKAMSEPDICWKYVDGITAEMADDKGNAVGDITLNVKYRDAREINLENYAGAYSGEDGSYELQITTKIDYTSPISDALTTASKLLGIDDASSQFNTMERDDSGDYENLVSWSTRKVLLKTSQYFDLYNPGTWTYSDQIIVYEYFRFESDGVASNNTLANYTIDDFKDGVEVDARVMYYRNFNSNTGLYSEEQKQFCVKLNNTYYRVKESQIYFDDYGHPYYMLEVTDKNVNYFTDATISIEKIGTTDLKFSGSLNDADNWNTTEQVLVYEYFKNLSLSNELVNKYKFTDFMTGDGVEFNVYQINGSSEYVYINGTYYQLSGSSITGGNFLKKNSADSNTRWFGYKLTAEDRNKYGIDNLGKGVGLLYTDSDLSNSFEPIDDTDGMYQRYSSMNFTLSDNFSFYNSDTWTFRDYAIIYLYITELKKDSSVNVDSLKYSGLNGTYGISNSTYYMQLNITDSSNGTRSSLYINMEVMSKTSELRITQTLAPEIFNEMDLNVPNVGLLTSYQASMDTHRLISESAANSVGTHKFELSEDFDDYDADTWTVGDYLILYLIKAGIIETETSLIEVLGYTSLVYEVNDKYYYRFGKEGDMNAFYLDESAIISKGYDVDKWFNTNLMQFLLIDTYKTDTSDIVFDESAFGGGAFIDKDAYIYDITKGTSTNPKNLQYYLAEQIYSLGISINDTSKIEYSYSNPELVATDLTSWKYLDLLIYQKTGTLPTTSNPYTSNIYKDNENNYYFYIKDISESSKDIFVNITPASDILGRCYASATSGIMSHQIVSKHKKSFGEENLCRKYYGQYFTTKVEQKPTGSDSISVYYYSDTFKSATPTTAVFEENKAYSDFEIILLFTQGISVQLTERGYYVFSECFILNDTLYVKIGDINANEGRYITLSKSEFDKIYYIENSLVPEPGDGIFRVSSTPAYTSFKYGSFTKLDALLYSLVGTTEGKEYTVYEYRTNSSNKYIQVNNTFVKYDDALVTGSTSELPNIDDSAKRNDYVDYLYNNFYSSYVSSKAPIISATYSGNFTGSINWYDGLNVILNKKGISLNSSNPKLILSTSGDYYLSCRKDKELFINLSAISEVKITFSSDGNSIELKAIDSELSRWRLNNTIEKIETIHQEDGSDIEVVSYEARKAAYLKDDEAVSIHNSTNNPSDYYKYAAYATESRYSNSIISVSGVASNLAIPSTLGDKEESLEKLMKYFEDYTDKFTFVNLLSLHLDPRNEYKNLKRVYSLKDRKEYVVFENYGEQLLIPYEFTIDSTTYEITDQIVSSNGIFKSEEIESDEIEEDGDGNPSTILAKLLKQKNYTTYADNNFKLTSSVLKDENGDDLVIYFVINAEESLNDMYAICGMKNETIAQVDENFKYLYVDDASTTVKEDGTASQAELFLIQTSSIKYSNDWTMIDYIISYVTGLNQGAYFTSEICIYQNNYYIKYGDKYILLPKKGATNTPKFEVQTNILGRLSTENSSKLSYMLVQYVKPLSVYNSDFVNKISQDETALNDAVNGIRTHIRFSETFDIRDTSTWSIADYILYYVCTNDFYKTNDPVGLRIPFTYIPSFVVSGNIVSNLTYFDLYLADALKSNDANVGYTEYLYNNNNTIYRFNIIRDSDFNYYVEIKDDYYVKLSDYVYTDYSKMELKSSVISESFPLYNDINNCGLLEDKIDSIKMNDLVVENSIVPKTFLSSSIENGNFQTLANSHGALGFVHYLFKQDENTGSVELCKVIEFNAEGGQSGSYFKYDKFFEFYGSSFADYAETIKENELTIEIQSSMGALTGSDLKVEVAYEQKYPDFEFKNYYYFNAELLPDTEFDNVDNGFQEGIIQGTTTLEKAKVNLKLSENFDITDIGTWDVIDYIVMQEYARDVNHNKFKDMSFSELSEDTFVDIYIDRGAVVNYFMYLNGRFYNLKGVIDEVVDDETGQGTGVYVSNGTKELSIMNSNVTKPIASVVSSGNINSYNFRVLKEIVGFNFNESFASAKKYNRDKENISYIQGSVMYLKYIDIDMAYANYRINVSRFGKYSTEIIVKKSSWVEKLMTDMQVYYPDLNWGTLIATDGWLDTLGEFTSAYTNGLFVGNNNSSNTTAAGLVLSEFFMSVANEVDGGYADYEYSSVFDEETVQSLMLSLMGEENYKALVFEAKVFMDYFNSSFAPIIDDFAEEFGESIQENSLRLNAYKSYLATLLLSSDIGEYLYTIATRIYAEYTIGEYLACSGGDYTGYYSYVNLLKDENGERVDSFNYGTFNELVIYENQYCGKNNPTFTFNVAKAFERYSKLDSDGNDTKFEGQTLEEHKSTQYESLVSALVSRINEDYKEIYENKYQVSESGKVINSLGEEISSYSDQTYPYCYMIHVYWEIYWDINRGRAFELEPSYLDSYKDYIDGSLDRWAIFSDASTEDADQYFEDASREKTRLETYRILSFVNVVRLYCPTLVVGGNNDDGIVEKLWKVYEALRDRTISIPMNDALNMFDNNNASGVVNYAKTALEFVNSNSLALYFTMGFSQDADNKLSIVLREFLESDLVKEYIPIDFSVETSWNTVLEFSDNLDIVIAELKKVRELLPGESTELGSNRVETGGATPDYYTNDQIDHVLSVFQDLRANVTQYIATQERLDRMDKRAITFTLAQYGSNYVSSGYKFTVRNKDYMFKNNIDPSRIAEYVYGGAFLESVGVGAQYTDPEFTGIVQASRVYVPSETNYDNVYDPAQANGSNRANMVLKTSLVTWPRLRAFASNFADKTAELYFLTNLKDLDVGTKNGVNFSTEGNGIGYSMKKQIVDFIVKQFDANLKTDETQTDISDEAKSLINRICGFSSYPSNPTQAQYNVMFEKLSLYIFSNNASKEELANMTFEQYKRIAMREVIENEQNGEESAEERANRYMTLFNLLGVSFEFEEVKGSGASKVTTSIGSIVRPAYVYDEKNNPEGIYFNSNNSGVTVEAKIKFSNSTINIIKTMSGLENRPTPEVLTREYGGLRTADYFDEAFGDTFIVCAYKNGLYYPILASGSKVCSAGGSYNSPNTGYQEFYAEDGSGILTKKFTSEYLDTGSYPIVAKGIITPDGNPTAIRKYNNPIEISQKKLLKNTTQVYNAVTYYRTNIGGYFGAGNDLVQSSRAIARVTTKNYTKYIYGTNFTTGLGSTTTFTGRNNLKTLVSSDYQTKFVQSKVEYLTSDCDTLGGISVLDEFSYFYVLSGQSWMLLILAFVTVIPVLINAIGGVISRIFDLIVLFIVSPLVISTNSLYIDGKNNVYKKWKKNVESVLWSALGYIIGFSAFSLMVPVVYNVNRFVEVGTFENIISLGGVGKFVKYPTINALMRSLWMITVVTVLEKLPKLLLPILTANNGDVASPHPGLGGGGKDFISKAKEMGGEVSKQLNKLKSIASGRALMGLVEAGKSQIEGMIPGLGTVKNFAEKKQQEKRDKTIDKESKLIEKLLVDSGIDKKTAQTVGQSMKDAEARRKKAKEKDKKDKEKYKKEFQNLFK